MARLNDTTNSSEEATGARRRHEVLRGRRVSSDLRLLPLRSDRPQSN